MISVLKKSRPVHYISCTKELLHQTRCLWPHAVTTKLTFGNNTNKKYVNYDFRSVVKRVVLVGSYHKVEDPYIPRAVVWYNNYHFIFGRIFLL